MKKSAIGREPMYPWDRWLGYKREFVVRRWIDYECETHSMVLMFRARARKEGLKLSIQEEPHQLTVKVIR